MDIRYMTATDDRNEISEVYEQSWKHAYQGIIPDEFLESIPQGKWAEHLNREGMFHLVAIDEGRIVGTASFGRSRWEKHPKHGEIVSIYLLPEYMGQGIGAKLLRACYTQLRQQDYERVLLWVLEDNQRARNFYEKNGFICQEETMESEYSGKMVKEVLYEKEL